MAGSIDLADEIEPATPGFLLKQAREAAGLSQREVGDAINLLGRQIDALEKADYQQLNGAIFCKGYLRAYAKLMDMDVDLIVDLYKKQQPETEDIILKLQSGLKPAQNSPQGRNIQYGSFAAFIAVVVGLWLFSANQIPTTNAISELSGQDVVVDQNDLSALHSLEQELLLDQNLRTDTHQYPDNEIEAVETPRTSLNRTNDDLFSMTSDLTESVKRIDNGNNDWLSFRFQKDCWVQVTDSQGKVLFAALKKARDTLQLSGKGPFMVVLGYAPGVSLDFNGEPVAINVTRENNSAQLVIGQI